MKKLYVGNLSYQTTDEELESLFAEYGKVESAKIIRDKFNNSSKGFGFVEMEDADEAETAISALDGTDFNGRNLKVNEARPKAEGTGGGGGRGGHGGGGRGGFGGGGGGRGGHGGGGRGGHGGGGGGGRGGHGGGRGGGGGGGRW